MKRKQTPYIKRTKRNSNFSNKKTLIEMTMMRYSTIFLLFSFTHGLFEVCDDYTCCPGTVCQEGKTRPSCGYATSCDEVECPAGLRCVSRKSGKVDCELSCDDVNCPNFLDCELRGKRHRSYAVCTLPHICDPLGCPNGTSCLTIGRHMHAGRHMHTGRHSHTGRHRHAFCLADTCENVDCGSDAICRDGTIRTRTNERSNSVRRFLSLLSGRGKRSHSKSSSKSRSRSTGAQGNQMMSIATCFAECTNSTCPDGLVCEERRFELVCRLPRTCEELKCPDGQECIVTSCGKGKRRFTGTKTRSKQFVQCVDIISLTSTSLVTSSVAMTTTITTSTIVSTSSIAMTTTTLSTNSIAMTTTALSTSSIAMTTTTLSTSSIAMTTTETSTMSISSVDMSPSPTSSTGGLN